MILDNSKTKTHWDTESDKYYKICDTETIIKKIIENPSCAFQKRTFEIIQKCFPDIKGKKVCVPSSGDNTAVLAIYLLGAQVTSTDISSEQI